MEDEERLTQYRMNNQNIRDYKANQWRFSHYGLLIQAALVAAAIQISTNVMWIFSVAVAALVVALIDEAQKQIVQCRKISRLLQKPVVMPWSEFTDTHSTRAQDTPPARWENDLPFFMLFAGVQLAGMILASTIILLG